MTYQLNTHLSFHANYRATQWNLTNDEIQFVVKHGKHTRRAGVIFCQMQRKQMPDAIPPNHPYWRLTGTTVVLCKCGWLVVTVYRNDKAFKRDSRKQKYAIRDGAPWCAYCKRHIA